MKKNIEAHPPKSSLRKIYSRFILSYNNSPSIAQVLASKIKDNLLVLKKMNAFIIIFAVLLIVCLYALAYRRVFFQTNSLKQHSFENKSGIILQLTYPCKVIFVSDMPESTVVGTSKLTHTDTVDNYLEITLKKGLYLETSCTIVLGLSQAYKGKVQIHCKNGCQLSRSSYDTLLNIKLVVIGISCHIYFRNTYFESLEFYLEDSNVNLNEVNIRHADIFFKKSDFLFVARNDFLMSLSNVNSNYVIVDDLFIGASPNPECDFYKHDFESGFFIESDLNIGKLNLSMFNIYKTSYDITMNCKTSLECDLYTVCTNIAFRNPLLAKYTNPEYSTFDFGNNSKQKSVESLQTSIELSSTESVGKYQDNEYIHENALTDHEYDFSSNFGIIKMFLEESNMVIVSSDLFFNTDYYNKKFSTDDSKEDSFLQTGLDFNYSLAGARWSSLRNSIRLEYNKYLQFFMKYNIIIFTSKNCAISDPKEKTYNWIYFNDKASKTFLRNLFMFKNYPLKNMYKYNICRPLTQYNYNVVNFFLYFIYSGVYLFKQFSIDLEGNNLQQILWISDKEHFLERLSKAPIYFKSDLEIFDIPDENCKHFVQYTLDKMNYITFKPYECNIHMTANIFLTILAFIAFFAILLLLITAQYFIVSKFIKQNALHVSKRYFYNNSGDIKAELNKDKSEFTSVFKLFFGLSYNAVAYYIIKAVFWDTRNSFDLFFRNLIKKKTDPINDSQNTGGEIDYQLLEKAYYNFCYSYSLPVTRLQTNKIRKLYKDKRFAVVEKGECEIWIEDTIIVQIDHLENILYDFNQLKNSLDVFVHFCCKKYRQNFDTLYSDFKSKYEVFCQTNNFARVDCDIDTLKNEFGLKFVEKKRKILTSLETQNKYMINKPFLQKYVNTEKLTPKYHFLLYRGELKLKFTDLVQILLYYILADWFFLGVATTAQYLLTSTETETYIDMLDFASIRSVRLFVFNKYFSLISIVVFLDRYFIDKRDIYCRSIMSCVINVPVWCFIYLSFIMKIYFVSGYIRKIFEFIFDIPYEVNNYDYIKIVFLFSILVLVVYLRKYFVLRNNIRTKFVQDKIKSTLDNFKGIENNHYFKTSKTDIYADKMFTRLEEHEILNFLEYLLQNRASIGSKFKTLFYNCCVRLKIDLSPNLFDLLLIIIDLSDKKLTHRYIDFVSRTNITNLKFKSANDFNKFEKYNEEYKRVLIKMLESSSKDSGMKNKKSLNILIQSLCKNIDNNLKGYLSFLASVFENRINKRTVIEKASEMLEQKLSDNKTLQILLYVFKKHDSTMREYQLTEFELQNYIKRIFPSKGYNNETFEFFEQFYVTFIKFLIQSKSYHNIITIEEIKNISEYINKNVEVGSVNFTVPTTQMLFEVSNFFNMSAVANINNVKITAKKLGISQEMTDFIGYIEIMKLSNSPELNDLIFPDAHENFYLKKLVTMLNLSMAQFEAIVCLLVKYTDDRIILFIELMCKIHKCENKCDFLKFLYTLFTRNNRDDYAIMEKYLSYNSVVIFNYFSCEYINYAPEDVKTMLNKVRKSLESAVPRQILDTLTRAIENKDIEAYREIKNDLITFIDLNSISQKSMTTIVELDLIFQILMPKRNVNQIFKHLKKLHEAEFLPIYEKIYLTFANLCVNLQRNQESMRQRERIDISMVNKISFLLNINSEFLHNIILTLFGYNEKLLYEFVIVNLADKNDISMNLSRFINLNSSLRGVSNSMQNVHKVWINFKQLYSVNDESEFVFILIEQLMNNKRVLSKDHLNHYINIIVGKLYSYQAGAGKTEINEKLLNFLESLCKSVLQNTSRYLSHFFTEHERESPLIPKLLLFYFSEHKIDESLVIEQIFDNNTELKNRFYLPTLIYFKSKKANIALPYKFMETYKNYPFKVGFFSFIDIFLENEVNVDLLINSILNKSSKDELTKAKVFDKFILQLQYILYAKLKQKFIVEDISRLSNIKICALIYKLKNKFNTHTRRKKNNNSKFLQQFLSSANFDDLFQTLDINVDEFLVFANIICGHYELSDIVSFLNLLKVEDSNQKSHVLNIFACFRPLTIIKSRGFKYCDNLGEISSIFSKLFSVSLDDSKTLSVIWMYVLLIKGDFYSFIKLLKSSIFKSLLHDCHIDAYLTILFMYRSESLYKVEGIDLLQSTEKFIDHKNVPLIANSKETFMIKLLNSYPKFAFQSALMNAYLRPSLSNNIDSSKSITSCTSIITSIIYSNIHNKMHNTLEPVNIELINFLVRFTIGRHLNKLSAESKVPENAQVKTLLKGEILFCKKYFVTQILQKKLQFDFRAEYVYLPEFEGLLKNTDNEATFYQHLNKILFDDYLKVINGGKDVTASKNAEIRLAFETCCSKHSFFSKDTETTNCIFAAFWQRNEFYSDLLTLVFERFVQDLRHLTNPNISKVLNSYPLLKTTFTAPENESSDEEMVINFLLTMILSILKTINEKRNAYNKKKFDYSKVLLKMILNLNIAKCFTINEKVPSDLGNELYGQLIDMVVLTDYNLKGFYSKPEQINYRKFCQTYYWYNTQFVLSHYLVFIEYFTQTFILVNENRTAFSELDSIQIVDFPIDTVYNILNIEYIYNGISGIHISSFLKRIAKMKVHVCTLKKILTMDRMYDESFYSIYLRAYDVSPLMLKVLMMLIGFREHSKSIYQIDLRSYFSGHIKSNVHNLFDLLIILLKGYDPDLLKNILLTEGANLSFYDIMLNNSSNYDGFLDFYDKNCHFSYESRNSIKNLFRTCNDKLSISINDFTYVCKYFVKKSYGNISLDQFGRAVYTLLSNRNNGADKEDCIFAIHRFCTDDISGRYKNEFKNLLILIEYINRRQFSIFERLDAGMIDFLFNHMQIKNIQTLKIFGILNVLKENNRNVKELDKFVYNFISYSDYNLFNVNIDSVMNVIKFIKYFRDSNITELFMLMREYFSIYTYVTSLSLYTYFYFHSNKAIDLEDPVNRDIMSIVHDYMFLFILTEGKVDHQHSTNKAISENLRLISNKMLNIDLSSLQNFYDIKHESGVSKKTIEDTGDQWTARNIESMMNLDEFSLDFKIAYYFFTGSVRYISESKIWSKEHIEKFRNTFAVFNIPSEAIKQENIAGVFGSTNKLKEFLPQIKFYLEYNENRVNHLLDDNRINPKFTVIMRSFFPLQSLDESVLVLGYLRLILDIIFAAQSSDFFRNSLSVLSTSCPDNYTKNKFKEIIERPNMRAYYKLFQAIEMYKQDKIANRDHFFFYLQAYFDKEQTTEKERKYFKMLFHLLEGNISIFDFWVSKNNSEIMNIAPAVKLAESKKKHSITEHTIDHFVYEQKVKIISDQYKRLQTKEKIRYVDFSNFMQMLIELVTNKNIFTRKDLISITEMLTVNKHDKEKIKYYLREYQLENQIMDKGNMFTKIEVIAFTYYVISQEGQKHARTIISKKYVGSNVFFSELYIILFIFFMNISSSIAAYMLNEIGYFTELLVFNILYLCLTIGIVGRYAVVSYDK